MKNLFVIFAIGLMFFSLGCIADEKANEENRNMQDLENEGELYSPTPKFENGKNDILVEIFHFHGNSQCYSCVRLGELADGVVEKYFQDEVESGKLTYAHVNAQAEENAKLAEEYQVSSISLQIGTTINGVKTRENLQQVWYYLEDEEGFANYLVPLLQKRLIGELS